MPAVGKNNYHFFLSYAGKLAGRVNVSAGVPSLADLSGDELDQGEITIADNGVGDFTITIRNFRGPQSRANVQATPTAADVAVRVASKTYTAGTDNLVVQFVVRTISGTPAASDTGFEFVANAW